MRLLVVDHVGLIKVIRQRYNRLVKKLRVKLTLLTPHFWIENSTPVRYQADPDEQYPTIVGKVVFPGKEQASFYLTGLVKAFWRSKPDVILMMEEAFSLFGLQVILLKRIFAPSAPIIFYSFNVISYQWYMYRFPLFYRILGKLVGPQCDIGLCPNDHAVSVLREAKLGVDVRKLFIGIDETVFVPIERAVARSRIGVRQNCDLFLYAGRLLELKGVQDLIDAFASLTRRLPERDMMLLIVGSGDYESALKQKAGSYALEDRIVFTSAVPLEQMSTYICSATAFVLPSRVEWNEQFGRVNAEAMLLNTTIIGSTSGQIPAVIGEGGFLFEANNISALEQTMERVLFDTEEVERRRDLGRQKALKEYSLQGFVDGLAETITELNHR